MMLKFWQIDDKFRNTSSYLDIYWLSKDSLTQLCLAW